MKMNRARSAKYFTFTAVVLLIVAWAVSGWAGGPSAQDTVRFLDQKLKEHGGGFAMMIDSDQKVRYTRIFQVALSMPRDGTLILETAEQTLIEGELLPDEEINPRLAGLELAGAQKMHYEIPLGKMAFGWLSNRRGDWRARKTLKKSSGKIRILCQDKLNCIKINRQPDGNYVDLYVEDELQREKLFKAIKHLIGLYQHRKELF